MLIIEWNLWNVLHDWNKREGKERERERKRERDGGGRERERERNENSKYNGFNAWIKVLNMNF